MIFTPEDFDTLDEQEEADEIANAIFGAYQEWCRDCDGDCDCDEY